MLKKLYAGLAISIGCIVYLGCSDPVVGAFLFACGLLAVRIYRLELYTGQVQFILSKTQKATFYLTVLVCNALAAHIIGWIMSPLLGSAAEAIVMKRLTTPFFVVLLQSIGCGMLMSIATSPNTPLWVSVLCVAAFILGGLSHCIADAFYYGAAHHFILQWPWLASVFGNTIGGAIFTNTLINRGET